LCVYDHSELSVTTNKIESLMKYHSFFSAYILLTDWCAVTLTDEQAKLNDKPEKLIISPSP